MLVDSRTRDAGEEELRARIADAGFPCVGAKSALARGTLKTLVCHSIASGWDDLRIHRELMDWAEEYKADPTGLRSLAVVFAQSPDLDEPAFERLMWERIQSLADKDHWLGQSYDDSVSADPNDPHFSLSFGGEAFFVVGLHPNASRPARRFPRPTLVFNLHAQFEALREEGKYERMRAKIIERDVELAGTVNPMLARHGEASEARQYSGRVVEDGWRCPFRDKRADGSGKRASKAA
ncbi:guanitoxin biosynthesis heme-dependent pre-guanitoxin N-hydroxylase GntA [Qipengyuania sediminis]|uniref:guanitoxin biosynthesis heme-dependent pre-guanitoxin N-hydroxylase GntA n=1 Tax=Qipengyuania sediminis TaxID=1532023 RepID=UPI00105A43C1|nr:guanitoxin biosynthesis heme-dependent pre-guanitoxin N-hydroxylase GntA [Qipengyuania sediminis]